MREINILEQDIRCCGDFYVDIDCINIEYELWFVKGGREMNKAGEKVKKIIDEEFDGILGMMVISYILEKGMENIKEIDETELMPGDFAQALVRCAAIVCKECDKNDDFLPYIINYLPVPAAQTKEIEFYQEEMTKYRWERFVESLGINYKESADEILAVTLNANVVQVYREEE